MGKIDHGKAAKHLILDGYHLSPSTITNYPIVITTEFFITIINSLIWFNGGLMVINGE
jgi:hypothetical protein